MLRDHLPGDIVALLVPVPRLPSEECSYAADILRKKVDARRTQIVGLNRDVWQVPSLLDPGLEIRLALLDRCNSDFRTLRQRELPSRLHIQLLGQFGRHWLDRELDEEISA